MNLGPAWPVDVCAAKKADKRVRKNNLKILRISDHFITIFKNLIFSKKNNQIPTTSGSMKNEIMDNKAKIPVGT